MGALHRRRDPRAVRGRRHSRRDRARKLKRRYGDSIDRVLATFWLRRRRATQARPRASLRAARTVKTSTLTPFQAAEVFERGRMRPKEISWTRDMHLVGLRGGRAFRGTGDDAGRGAGEVAAVISVKVTGDRQANLGQIKSLQAINKRLGLPVAWVWRETMAGVPPRHDPHHHGIPESHLLGGGQWQAQCRPRRQQAASATSRERNPHHRWPQPDGL